MSKNSFPWKFRVYMFKQRFFRRTVLGRWIVKRRVRRLLGNASYDALCRANQLQFFMDSLSVPGSKISFEISKRFSCNG